MGGGGCTEVLVRVLGTGSGKGSWAVGLFMGGNREHGMFQQEGWSELALRQTMLTSSNLEHGLELSMQETEEPDRVGMGVHVGVVYLYAECPHMAHTSLNA